MFDDQKGADSDKEADRNLLRFVRCLIEADMRKHPEFYNTPEEGVENICWTL